MSQVPTPSSGASEALNHPLSSPVGNPGSDLNTVSSDDEFLVELFGDEGQGREPSPTPHEVRQWMQLPLRGSPNNPCKGRVRSNACHPSPSVRIAQRSIHTGPHHSPAHQHTPTLPLTSAHPQDHMPTQSRTLYASSNYPNPTVALPTPFTSDPFKY